MTSNPRDSGPPTGGCGLDGLDVLVLSLPWDAPDEPSATAVPGHEHTRAWCLRRAA